MKQITSFTINHDYLKPGMYISRVDGDVVTYDMRMKLPNNPAGDYLEDIPTTDKGYYGLPFRTEQHFFLVFLNMSFLLIYN